MESRFEARVEGVVPAPAGRVWEAFASNEGFAQVFEGITVECSWIVGTPIVWSGSWEGKTFRDEGTLMVFEPPVRLEYTYWTSFWGPSPTPETVQRIVNEFEPVPGGTRVVIRQTNIPSAESRDHSEKNWREILDRVAKSFL